MNKRAYERIPASLEVRFFLGNSLCKGFMKNLSENGMCIKTRLCFPFESRFELLIPLKEKIMDVAVKVSRVKKTVDFYDTMGVEVLNQPKEYLEFVNSIKAKEFIMPLKFIIPLTISDETLKQTIKCQSYFHCLTDNGGLCLIDKPINGKGLFIKERVNKDKNCPYIESSEDAFICNCPTRYEIYMRYNI